MGLLGFNITAIPPLSIITSATLALRVTDGGNINQIYEVLRPWTEAGCTYNRYDGVTLWTTAGCNGVGTDRNNTILGNTLSGTGFQNIVLNASGVAVIQNWLNTPANNMGFIIRGTGTNGVDFDSKETGTIANRPRLIIDYTSTLPISAFNFKAEQNDDNNVKLSWETLGQESISHFETERSVDGINWQLVDKVVLNHANTSSNNYYEILDNETIISTVYYRLKQVNTTNEIFYSNIEVIQSNKNKDALIYPTISNDYIFIKKTKENQNFQLINSSGKVVACDVTQIEQIYRIDLRLLIPGIYYIYLSEADITKKIKIVKV
jgi:hypothetical protein